jgi:phosphatidylglycerol:prolipoprotein diacylglycerol transferase
LLFITLALISVKLKDYLLSGDIVLGYLIGYSVGRFFVEFFRPDAWLIGPIAAAQLFALIIALVAAAILIIRHLRAKPATKSDTPSEVATAAPGIEAEATAQDDVSD